MRGGAERGFPHPAGFACHPLPQAGEGRFPESDTPHVMFGAPNL
jgi:hypothetical protein